jgi:hypothetical protein
LRHAQLEFFNKLLATIGPHGRIAFFNQMVELLSSVDVSATLKLAWNEIIRSLLAEGGPAAPLQ